LLHQIDSQDPNRPSRDIRPDWLTSFIDDAADLFEPLPGVARVGFQSELSENGWVVGLYLGRVEIIGGRHDGETQPVNFEFDLRALLGRFQVVDEFVFGAFPRSHDAPSVSARSFVTIAGIVGENPLRLQIYSLPPDHAGPGLKEFADGRCEPV
jgi:hypothetical protein